MKNNLTENKHTVTLNPNETAKLIEAFGFIKLNDWFGEIQLKYEHGKLVYIKKSEGIRVIKS